VEKLPIIDFGPGVGDGKTAARQNVTFSLIFCLCVTVKIKKMKFGTFWRRSKSTENLRTTFLSAKGPHPLLFSVPAAASPEQNNAKSPFTSRQESSLK